MNYPLPSKNKISNKVISKNSEIAPLLKQISKSKKLANLYLSTYSTCTQIYKISPHFMPTTFEKKTRKQLTNPTPVQSVNLNFTSPVPLPSNENQNKMFKNSLMNNNLSSFLNPLNSMNSIMSVNTQFCRMNRKSRVPFTKEEDEKIKNLAEKYGTRQWSLISSFLNGRTPKQCRDRYCNYLFPGYFKGEWTKEEDELLEKLFIENGPKWSVIQKSFPGRSSNSLKNRWNYFLCRQKKVKTKRKEEEETENAVIIDQNEEFDMNEDENEFDAFSLFPQNDEFLYMQQNEDIFGHYSIQNRDIGRISDSDGKEAISRMSNYSCNDNNNQKNYIDISNIEINNG